MCDVLIKQAMFHPDDVLDTCNERNIKHYSSILYFQTFGFIMPSTCIVMPNIALKDQVTESTPAMATASWL